jgi:hypothetical protein
LAWPGRRVGFYGGCLATAVPDAADDRGGALGPAVAVFLRVTAIIRIIDPLRV